MHKLFYKTALSKFYYDNFEKSGATDMSYMFALSQIESFDFNRFNTNKVKNMSHLFYNCISLININLLNIDTSSVEDMANLFSGLTSILELNVSSLNTQKVTNMSAMF